jgi:enoyl-CoA hydratase
MMLENVSIERNGDFAILRVNRPKALNALNQTTLKELSLALDELAGDTALKALIFTGAGEKAFIAGADISEMAKMSHQEALAFARLGQEVTLKLEQFPTPVVAAVNGFALGGGCELAISCDFILASANAVFGQPEVSLGLITGFGGAIRLAEFVGWPVARELIYTGRRIKAEEALKLGLANQVVPLAELLDKAISVAKEIGANSPEAVRRVKAAMSKVRDTLSIKDKLSIEAQAFSDGFGTHDQREGTSAFLEKRKPVFKAV